MRGLTQTIFPGTRLSNFAPSGLLETLDEEERDRLQAQTTQAVFQGAFSGTAPETQERLRNRFQTRFQNQQAQQQVNGLLADAVNSGALDLNRARALSLLPLEEKLKILTEQFTLNPGDLRGDTLGTIAAQPTQDIQEFQEAQRQGFTGTFRQFQDRNQRTEVSPGEAVIDADGNLVFRNPTPEQQNRDAGITDGAGGPARVPDQGPPESSVDPNVDISDATGALGAIRRSVNALTDLVGLGTVAPDTDRAVTELNNFRQAAKIVISEDATDGRRTNELFKMVDSLIPSDFLQGTQNAKNQLQALERLLTREINDQRAIIEQGLGNPTAIGKAQRAFRSLGGLREDTRVLLQNFGGSGEQPRQLDSETQRLLDKFGSGAF